MQPPGQIRFSAAVEGHLDEVVARRVLSDFGGILHVVFGHKGGAYIDKHIRGYNNAARFQPWVVLRDLDDRPCAAHYAQDLLTSPSEKMVFRVVVREIESWLLADRESIAAFIGVPTARIPAEPESLADPKRELIQIAQQSRRRSLRADITPRPGGGRQVGPLYVARMSEYVRDHWDPTRAESRSSSLRSFRRKVQAVTAILSG